MSLILLLAVVASLVPAMTLLLFLMLGNRNRIQFVNKELKSFIKTVKGRNSS